MGQRREMRALGGNGHTGALTSNSWVAAGSRPSCNSSSYPDSLLASCHSFDGFRVHLNALVRNLHVLHLGRMLNEALAPVNWMHGHPHRAWRSLRAVRHWISPPLGSSALSRKSQRACWLCLTVRGRDMWTRVHAFSSGVVSNSLLRATPRWRVEGYA